MTPTEIGLLTLAALTWVVVGVVNVVAKRFHRDEIFSGVTPGVVPPNPADAPRERVGGTSQEYDGEVAVAFSPPKGLRPGLVGTVVDGRVDSHDITGTLVDLAVRGHLTIEVLPGAAEPSADRRPYTRQQEASDKPGRDWLLTRSDRPAYDVLDPTEEALINGLFHGAPAVRMSQLNTQALQSLRETEVTFYREAVQRGWYRRHPQQQGGGGCFVIGAGAVLAALFLAVRHTWPGTLAAVLVLGASVLLTRALRGRTPRTAEGTAVRIQALGFKKYLQTAEAAQFKFEEAAGIFSRYLPYAMVFGVAQHWAKVFGDVARRAQASGWSGDGLSPDLTWFVVPGGPLDIGDLLFFDSLDGDLDLFGAADALADLGAGAVDGLGDLATGVGEFMGSLDFMDAAGDGCGDVGCGDAGCIDF